MWQTLLVLLAPVPQALAKVGEPPAGAAVHDGAAAPARLAYGPAEAAASHAKMIAALADIAQRADVTDLFVGNQDVTECEKILAELPPDKQNLKRYENLCKLAKAQLRLGDTQVSVENYTKAVALDPQLEGKVDPKVLLHTHTDLALAWLRLGENHNCVARHNSESCILPIGKKGQHLDQEGSRKAMEILLGVLKTNPNEQRALWLLNLAAMTVGEYPDGVPAEFRVPTNALDSDEPFPRFVDMAPELGLNTMNLAGGVILDDFDGDDVLDVVTSDMHPRGRLHFFKGHPDGTYTERSAEANFEGITGGLNINQTDYDNDGALDILVMRGAWSFDRGQVPQSLLHNDGHGTFTDVAFAAGLVQVSYPSQAGAWGDYDNDGDLDLYKGNESSPMIAAPCQLFRNNGDGTFTDVAKEAGVLNNRYAKGAVWGDYDGDRLLDLYVSNLDDLNRLYHNLGNGKFESVAADLGVQQPEHSFSAWFWDYDNDGALDIYVATFLPKVEVFVQDVMGHKGLSEYACLYHGDGKGHFTEVGAQSGFDDINVTMGSNFGDLDNDGFLDVYLGTGFPDYEALMPNRMYWNRGGKRFSDVTTNGGFGHLQKGHGIAFADLDHDGDTDVFAHMGGAFAGDGFGNAVFRNPGFGNHCVTVKLVGVRTNRAAIGARIRCDITENGVKRSVYRTVTGGSSFGANPLRQTLGLGKAAKVDVLEVYWPTSDRKQTFRDVGIDQSFEIREDRDELKRLE